MTEKNEFEGIDISEGVPDKEFSEVPDQQSEMISSGVPGTKYDWKQAPEGVKAPPRMDLDGKTVTIKKADIILPPESSEWSKTKAGDKLFKYCTFSLTYDIEGQQEFYSGFRVFKRDDNKYSHPTVTRDRKSQASSLLGLYADFKKKDINEISLKEYMSFLNSQPKAKIKVKEFMNPTNNKVVRKNLVGEFINP